MILYLSYSCRLFWTIYIRIYSTKMTFILALHSLPLLVFIYNCSYSSVLAIIHYLLTLQCGPVSCFFPWRFQLAWSKLFKSNKHRWCLNTVSEIRCDYTLKPLIPKLSYGSKIHFYTLTMTQYSYLEFSLRTLLPFSEHFFLKHYFLLF